ncbi:MAG: selenocysteine-specific translation elongation factor [Defluviitaleaceae bacterium]|nr:selenocysteine-specific translation elongation factor [Defluviitaleaceae bacterium]
MKHILIGTAGHVDHGKTALIRALTGIDTDRLKEEKKRGITIDLGFAYMELPGGGRVSIVDVPGHEKFIKNMLAGAGGIDLVLLVIAADDGVMPQTREHLGILQLLNAKDGIIVLTKTDLVDDDWLGLVSEDVRVAVADTFLQDAPMACVSSFTGQGIDSLKNIIIEKIGLAASKNTAAPFRIPVDRVFSSEGFGTVVTGTLIEGALNNGDTVQIYPGDLQGRVRNLQVHGGSVGTAYAGQRVAVNLSGISREEISRGDVLAFPGSLQPTRMLDVKLSTLKDSPREIKSGTRLHFYYGTKNVLCKAVLMDAALSKLTPGAEGYAQLRFATEVAVKRGDSFVLRFYSPTETVGGGVVLNESPKKHRKIKAAETIKTLETLEQGGLGENIQQAIADAGIASLEEVQKRFGLDKNAWQEELSALIADKRITLIAPQTAIEANYRKALGDKISAQLSVYHKENPLQPGIKKEELRSRILPGQKPAFFDKILQLYDDILRLADGRVTLCDFKITYTKEQALIRDEILSRLKQGGFTPPSPEELLQKSKAAEQVLAAMLTEGVIISAEQGILFAAETVAQAKEIFRALAENKIPAESKSQGGQQSSEQGGVTLAEFRDATNASRKFALSLLEFFDRTGFTRKTGDSRVLH